MRSMTGFGVGEASSPFGRLVIEVRAVNHRFLDVRIKLPREMVDQCVFVEQCVRTRLTRGRIDVLAHCEGGAHAPVMLDRARAVALFREFQAVAEELGIAGPVPLAVLANAPDLYLPVHDRDPAATRASLEAALGHAIEALDRMRAREGAMLRDDFLRRVARVTALCSDVQARAEAMTEHYRGRLRERIARLVEGMQLDTARIEQEVALLADHSDVTEELTRLACHRAALEGLLTADEPVGRRLDFVLQEMAREANTLGAKAAEVEVNAAVLALKSEIERMREQAQNIE